MPDPLVVPGAPGVPGAETPGQPADMPESVFAATPGDSNVALDADLDPKACGDQGSPTVGSPEHPAPVKDPAEKRPRVGGSATALPTAVAQPGSAAMVETPGQEPALLHLNVGRVEVAWRAFCPGCGYASYPGTQGHARNIAEAQARLGCEPLVQSQTVTYSDWVTSDD